MLVRASAVVLQLYLYHQCQDPALLHHHALIPDQLLTYPMVFSTLVLKLFFSRNLSLHSRLSLPQGDILEL